MGPELIARALDGRAQVVLSGRASDPASSAALAMRAQLSHAPSWYAGKMLECRATPSIPKGHDCLFVTVRHDHIGCEPTNPARKCTPLSIANHSLRENSSPIELTIDVVFEDPDTFRRTKATSVLCPDLFARLYDVQAETVLFTPYDAAFVVKATLPRLVPAGDFDDTDVYGCQQHAPLLDVDVSI
jgi:Domain of unknown function (DUF4387)/Acyclic terpene utilisation family protein AtuA